MESFRTIWSDIYEIQRRGQERAPEILDVSVNPLPPSRHGDPGPQGPSRPVAALDLLELLRDIVKLFMPLV